MTVHRIGGASVVLYVSPEDLKEHNSDARHLDPVLARKLTEEALRRHCIESEGTLEIEAFPIQCGVLLLARVCIPEPVYFRFSDLEGVILASQAVPASAGRLFRIDGDYIMALPEGRTACRLTEFAAPLECGAGYEAWLLEHGELILSENALQRFAGIFSK